MALGVVDQPRARGERAQAVALGLHRRRQRHQREEDRGERPAADGQPSTLA
jgi:hypothetical protein